MVIKDASLPLRRLREALARLADETRGRPRTGLTHQDADDVTGTAGTDDAAGFDPLPLLRALDLAGARVVVIGQVAGIMHGSRELTGDLDLLWDGDTAQAGLLAAAFTHESAQLTNDDGVPVPCDPGSLPPAQDPVPHRQPPAATAARRPCPGGTCPVTDFIGRCDAASAGDFTIRYLSRQDLIRMRQAIGRVKDLRRAAELQALR